MAALLLLGTVSLSGCSLGSGRKAALTIVCTNFVGYDLVREMIHGSGYDTTTGDLSVEVILLSKKGQDLHNYEPSAEDVAHIATADLFVYVGGESEAWVKSALEAANNPTLRTVCMMDSCEDLIEEDDGEAHTEGTVVTYDEHVWTSPANAFRIVNDVDAQIMRIIDEKELAFDWMTMRNGTTKLMSALEDWQSSFKGLMTDAKRNVIVIADRYPFVYLMRDMGLTCYAAFPGCSSETQASFATQVMLVEKVREYSLPVIFTVDNSLGSVASTVAAETGAEIRRLYSGQTIPGEAEPQTYLDMLEYNYYSLKEALHT